MTAPLIRAALETALAAMSPALSSAWENDVFTPTVGTPWQRIDLMHADPRPMEQGGKLHEERGIMQVSLFYPLNTGPGAAETRAELIRSTFKHGALFTASGVTVTISNTPSIFPLDDPAWFGLAVRVPFYAQIWRT